jgi:hypothetical protein
MSRGDFLALRVIVHDAPAKPLGSLKEMGELTRATTTPPLTLAYDYRHRIRFSFVPCRPSRPPSDVNMDIGRYD